VYECDGRRRQAKHAEHLSMDEGGMKMEGMQGMHHGAEFEEPHNTLPMMTGTGLFDPIERGGMFTVFKIRDGKIKDKDTGWYENPPGIVAKCVNRDLDFTPALLGKNSKISIKGKA
jgi:hypothetical protein